MTEEKAEKNETKKENKPSWIKIKPDEIEKIVVDLVGEGKSPGQIGLILRDKHGVPKTKLFGKKITRVLNEKDVKYKSDADIIREHTEKLKLHIAKKKHDHPASRSLTKKLWVLHSSKPGKS